MSEYLFRLDRLRVAARQLAQAAYEATTASTSPAAEAEAPEARAIFVEVVAALRVASASHGMRQAFLLALGVMGREGTPMLPARRPPPPEKKE